MNCVLIANCAIWPKKMFPSLQQTLADLANWNYWSLYMAPSCHICKRTGVRECDPEAAEIKCMLCGFCEAEKQCKERELGTTTR